MGKFIGGFGILFGLLLSVTAGVRPYEMEWAHRTHDDHTALLPMTDANGWSVETRDAEAKVESSQDVLLFGDGVVKLTFHATVTNAHPLITLKPSAPVPVNGPFDAVTCWIYGDTHCYITDPTRPTLFIRANFTNAEGKPFSVPLSSSRFNQWFLCHRRLSEEQATGVRSGGKFVSFTIENARTDRERTIYFNSLCVFQEEFPALSFKPRAKRGVQLFPDCPQGLNTGDGSLPFPNTADTMVPKDLTPSTKTVTADKATRTFRIQSGDEIIEYRLPAHAGNRDDLAMRYGNGNWITLASEGGIYFAPEKKGQKAIPCEADNTSVVLEDNTFVYRGKVFAKGKNADVILRVHVIDRSLVLDLQATGGEVGEIRFGYVQADEISDVTFPYYTYGYTTHGSDRPSVLLLKDNGKTLFLSETIDLTQSNASTPFAVHVGFNSGLAANGGTAYHPKTDGTRNSAFERFIFTCSPRIEDVLPSIPNPVSPWKHVTGKYVWHARGAARNRDHDAAFWRGVHRFGLRNILLTDHEVGWRDEDESFTFRTNAAPRKGGDAGQYKFARIMQDELHFKYGPYNNFTDFAPVNENWTPDIISRYADKNFIPAWERCYAPKPSRAVEFCELLAPVIQQKFHFSTAYCDVHTAVTPWERTDFDARVPGAGTFAATYYAFGEIMLLQKKAWNGPVYSEGNNHFPYCGLTDGNYAQDQRYHIAINPWLVDFDLRKMHPLCCNFGMGDIGMFFVKDKKPDGDEATWDRFLAATVAFGHPGYFIASTRTSQMRSYFLIQALASHYTQVDADTIRYLDTQGNLLDTSAALVSDAYQRNQIVTRYKDGTVTVVNGNPLLPLKTKVGNLSIELPANAFYGVSGDGSVHAFSGLLDGHRADCVTAPAYTYVDGRGQAARFPAGICDGQMAIRPASNLVFDVFVNNVKQLGLPVTIKKAEAFDKDWKPLGDAKVSQSDGYSFIQPVPQTVSYRITTSGDWKREPLTSIFGKRTEVPMPEITPTPISRPLPKNFRKGMAFRGKGEEALDPGTGAGVTLQSCTSGQKTRTGIFMHPPYQGGKGYSFACFRMKIPADATNLKGYVGKGDGSDPGDGIVYQVWVEENGTRKKLMEDLVTKHEWKEFQVSLAEYAGKRVSLYLVTDCGGNTSGDWGMWGDLQFTE